MANLGRMTTSAIVLILSFTITFSYPYFVSYVGQIGPGWGYSHNTVLLSNLGVPGYSNHPYNVLNFAFWISSSNAGATATATDCWQNLATYISDTTLRQTLTGKTNPTSTELRQAIKNIYIANNIQIFVSAFGANDHPESAGRNPTTVGTNLANYAIQYLYDGVDVDWEEGAYFNSVGAGETWLQTLTNTLYNVLNPITKDYLITHAPQAPYFMGRTLNQYPQGGYLTVHNNVGNKIDWYNIQFYNQGSTTYNTYSNMFQTSVGWSSNSAVYQMINGNNPEQISIPSNKIVIGKHSLGDGSDFVDGITLKNIFNQALANSPVWNTGFMCWQFYTENNQNPKFQVPNQVVAANWDLTATSTPTPPPSPTPAPVPTTPNPTGTGGGSGCVNGNICIKVKGFGGTPSSGSPVWWWAIYDENIINSLTSGCSITDCTNIEVKQSNTNTWVTAYNENGDCGIQMGDNPFTSSTISVDVRITTISNQVIVSNGVVQDTTTDGQWDFGSNFVSCTITTYPTQSPITFVPTQPTLNPIIPPTNAPIKVPTRNPTISPIPTTSNPTTTGGGGTCINGNICIKVKGFSSETPSSVSPVWWWAIYDENIINSLKSGCTITDCTGIEVKQSNTNTWVTAYNENNDCSIQMGDNPFTSSTISVDFRITTTNGKIIQSNGVVQATTAETEWDFGSNFISCTATSDPSKLPTKNPTTAPTSLPTPAPTTNPTPSPTTNPTLAPTSLPTPAPTTNPTPSPTTNPTPAPTINPTPAPTINPTIRPTKAPFTPGSPTKDPTNNTPQPSENPTKTPTDNPTKTPTDNPIAAPTGSPTKFPTNNPTYQPTESPLLYIPGSPTKAPTNITPSPSNNPTTLLPGTPTITPSIVPTDTTIIPTISPTMLPTQNPNIELYSTNLISEDENDNDNDGDSYIIGGKSYGITTIIIGAILVLGLILLIVMITVCVCMKRKKKLHEGKTLDNATEMIFAPTLKMKNEGYNLDGDINTGYNGKQTNIKPQKSVDDDDDRLFID